MSSICRSMGRHLSIGVLAWTLPAIAACGIESDPSTADFYQASSVHLKGGRNAEPAFTDLGLALKATGELAGLGEADVLITMTASANATATCTNPSGQNQPPGQNPAPVTVSGAQTIDASAIDTNGNTPFSVTTGGPTTPIPGAPGCPNPKWTEDITDLSFTGAVITVEQGGALVLTETCLFSPATSDGAVPSSTVSCTSS
jgi:hypothetical protein